MQSFFTTGHAVDLVLAFMAVEAVVFVMMKRRALTVVLRILPGAVMMLALRAAMTGASRQWVAIWLTVSPPLYLADLRRRRLI